jgi:phosphoribosylamine--glycine ligase
VKALIVGSAGREVALMERLLDEKHQVVVATDHVNPRLAWRDGLEVCAGHPTSKLIAELVVRHRPNAVFVFKERLIAAGLADVIEACGSRCFFPGTKYSALEMNKLEVMKIAAGICPELVPMVHKHNSVSSLLRSCRKSELAVFRVAGADGWTTHVINSSEVRASLINRWGIANTRLVEYRSGVDIALCCLCDGKNLVALPPTAQFPFRRMKTSFVKGGGWGAINVRSEDSVVSAAAVARCEMAIREILARAKVMLGGDGYRGFVVGQFRVDGGDATFIELDVRPGEPEFINNIRLLRPSLTESLLEPFVRGELEPGSHVNRDVAAISLCIAPPGYPCESVSGEPVDIPLELAEEADCAVYHSGAYVDKLGQLRSDGRRVCTLYTEGASLEAARQHLRSALSKTRIETSKYIFAQEVLTGAA